MVAWQEQEETVRLPVIQRHPFFTLGLVIVFIAGAIWVLEGRPSPQGAGDTTAITLTGGRTGVTPRVGAPAPGFTLETADGTAIALSELRGRPVLINFWATWCPPCRGEMPDLENVAREYRDAGLVVLAVNLEEDRATVQRYAQTLGLTFPLALDLNGVVAGQYNLTALPTSYFVDREGIVRDLNVGALTAKGLRSKLAKII